MEGRIEKLDVTDPDGIEDWHERFEQYVLTNADITPANKTAHYITLVGKEGYRLLKDLAYPKVVSTMDVDILRQLLEKHLRPVNFEAVERERFHNLTRKVDEPFKLFILRVQQQAARCNFGTELEVQMRDRLVAGIAHQEVKRKLLSERKLTFQIVKETLENWNDINSAMSKSSEVFAVPSRRNSDQRNSGRAAFPRRNPGVPRYNNQDKHSATPSRTPHPNNNRSGRCDSCGGQHSRRTCRFRTVQCRNCNKIGHIAKVCRSKDTHAVNIQTTDSDSEDNFKTFVVNKSHLYKTITFENGQTKEFVLDTGSPISFIPISVFYQLGFSRRNLQPTSTTITGVSGHSLPVVGQFKAMVRLDNVCSDIDLIITKSGPSVLGLDALRALKVNLVLHTSPSPSSEVASLIHQSSLNRGGMKVDPIHLQTQGDPKFLKARPIAFGLRDPVRKNLQELVAEGILKPVSSSVWATPIVTPIKPSGQPRICGDFRLTVNPNLLRTSTTTPEVEEMFHGLRGSTFFSRVDLTNAFLQIPLDEDSKQITTINTPWGLFQYQFLPFGLHVSSGIFQSVIDRILSGLQGVRAYQDDIFVFGRDKDQHDRNLLELLRILNKYNVKINARKSEFSLQRLKYLGYIVDGTGISADLDRIRALRLSPKPTTGEQLRSFLGFAQYYSKFVPNFSDVAFKLFDQAKMDELNWTNDMDEAYNTLMDALLNSRVLRSFQLGLPSVLVVDASQHSIGAVLEQEHHPVICISRKLSTAERNYSQIQKEALAIYWAVVRLHKYLYGTDFQIVTDHRALRYIFDPESSLSKSTTSMIQRWGLHLSAYRYTILHKPGKEIAQADFLSRFAYSEDPIPGEEQSLMTSTLPITRDKIIKETRLAYAPVLAGLRHGWSTSAKRTFPKLYARRNDLQLHADGVLSFNDKTVIPPACRAALLQHLHSGHLGRDKMISLARYICWWPSISTDIRSYARDCNRCQRKPNTHPTWTPWPIAYKPMQRVHADYCGPFLGRYWALVVEDASTKFPEVFFTTSANAEFTKRALRKFFAREGIAQVIVTDNGSHFTADHLKRWLHGIGCQIVYTPPRHPCSNGLAENFVRSLKAAISAANPTTFEDLENAAETFLLNYRNATHATTRKSPAMEFKGRLLRSVNLDSTSVQFFRGNNTRPANGIIIGRIGDRMFHVLDQEDGTVHRRHRDQLNLLQIPSENEEPSTTIQPSEPSPTLLPYETSTEQVQLPTNGSHDLIDDHPATSDENTTPDSPTETVTNLPRRSQRNRRRPKKLEDYIS